MYLNLITIFRICIVRTTKKIKSHSTNNNDMCCSDIDFKSIFIAANYLNRNEKNFKHFAVTATANATISMYCKLNVHHLQ